jgi:hypothetical protein
MERKEDFTHVINFSQKEGINAIGLDLFHEILMHVHLTPKKFELEDIEGIAPRVHAEIARDFKKYFSD